MENRVKKIQKKSNFLQIPSKKRTSILTKNEKKTFTNGQIAGKNLNLKNYKQRADHGHFIAGKDLKNSTNNGQTTNNGQSTKQGGDLHRDSSPRE